MSRLTLAFLVWSTALTASFADETKVKDTHASAAASHAAQGPYGALPPVAPEKNKPNAADALAGRLLQLGATRLETDALNTSPQNSSSPTRRPRAFDASEGTPLDPLRNETFDLNYPHQVPSIK